MYNSVDSIIKDKLIGYVKSLMNDDGSFSGDYAGEVDTRFSYCAVSILALLNALDQIDRGLARDFVLSC